MDEPLYTKTETALVKLLYFAFLNLPQQPVEQPSVHEWPSLTGIRINVTYFEFLEYYSSLIHTHNST